LHATVLSVEFIRISVSTTANVSIRCHRLEILGREEGQLWGQLRRSLVEVRQRRRVVGALVLGIPIGRCWREVLIAREEVLVGVDTRLHDA
jgi:hypothetical protein